MFIDSQNNNTPYFSEPVYNVYACSQGGVKVPTGGNHTGSPRASTSGGSRSGANPEPTVTVRIEENTVESRLLTYGIEHLFFTTACPGSGKEEEYHQQ